MERAVGGPVPARAGARVAAAASDTSDSAGTSALMKTLHSGRQRVQQLAVLLQRREHRTEVDARLRVLRLARDEIPENHSDGTMRRRRLLPRSSSCAPNRDNETSTQHR